MATDKRSAAYVPAPGDEVSWWYETRGGWGYVWRVPAYVVKVTAARVGIAALSGDGETWVPRWVRPDKVSLGHPSLIVSDNGPVRFAVLR